MSQSSFGLILGLAALATVATAPASAQVQAPPPQKHSCTPPPTDYPGKLGSDSLRRTWVRSANAYLDCLRKFAEEQKNLAKPYQDAAKVHIDAANAAIAEHNDAIKDINEKTGQAPPN
jgi:hypothetical protein